MRIPVIAHLRATTPGPMPDRWRGSGGPAGETGKLVKDLPVGVDRLRQDRILEESLANGADLLHLAHVFSLGAEASVWEWADARPFPTRS